MQTCTRIRKNRPARSERNQEGTGRGIRLAKHASEATYLSYKWIAFFKIETLEGHLRIIKDAESLLILIHELTLLNLLTNPTHAINLLNLLNLLYIHTHT
jgi:hypothetical protein